MSDLPKLLDDREYEKFVPDSSGNVSIRVKNEQVQRAVDVQASILEELREITYQLKLITGA